MGNRVRWKERCLRAERDQLICGSMAQFLHTQQYKDDHPQCKAIEIARDYSKFYHSFASDVDKMLQETPPCPK